MSKFPSINNKDPSLKSYVWIYFIQEILKQKDSRIAELEEKVEEAANETKNKSLEVKHLSNYIGELTFKVYNFMGLWKFPCGTITVFTLFHFPSCFMVEKYFHQAEIFNLKENPQPGDPMQ